MKQGIGIVLGVMVLFYAGIMVGIGLNIEAERSKPLPVRIIEVPAYIKVEKLVSSLRVERVEVIKKVAIHNEPGLYEFESLRELKDYVWWYRNERMVQHGVGQCEDYAYDFFVQAVADGYIVSTELYEKKVLDAGVLHMTNTAPIGNKVYLIEISAGSVELLALKD